jgi:hypothetical protein
MRSCAKPRGSFSSFGPRDFRYGLQLNVATNQQLLSLSGPPICGSGQLFVTGYWQGGYVAMATI